MTCEHGRNCVECPNKRLHEATEYLREAAHLFQRVREDYDNITVIQLCAFYKNIKSIAEFKQ